MIVLTPGTVFTNVLKLMYGPNKLVLLDCAGSERLASEKHSSLLFSLVNFVKKVLLLRPKGSYSQPFILLVT